MIIKPQDLRISNILLLKENGQDVILVTVEGINSLKVLVRDNSNRLLEVQINELSGIPLNPDWSTRLSKSIEMFHDGVMIYKCGGFNIYSQDGFFWVADSLNGHGKQYDHIRSVHQIQNLSYSLTGKEIDKL